jgi:hypothetical protein
LFEFAKFFGKFSTKKGEIAAIFSFSSVEILGLLVYLSLAKNVVF